MATPSRAPRRVAAKMSLGVADGTPVPGANAQTYTRKTASLDDANTYNKQRASAKVGLTPENVQVNTDTSPQP